MKVVQKGLGVQKPSLGQVDEVDKDPTDPPAVQLVLVRDLETRKQAVEVFVIDKATGAAAGHVMENSDLAAAVSLEQSEGVVDELDEGELGAQVVEGDACGEEELFLLELGWVAD